jgi:phosphopantothenoylcysteine decarboxylase / phosphopantothenate---cysteine ligase
MADACVIAPASTDFIAKVAHGLATCPASTLVQSYLGSGKPLIILPNMHNSLAQSPAYRTNLGTVAQWSTILDARMEEGKQKFPSPAVAADQICHILRRRPEQTQPVLVTMGSTRGYFDAVRFVSNISSGKMGTTIVEALYRDGFNVKVVAGPSSVLPQSIPAADIVHVETNKEMESAAQEIVTTGVSAGIFVAAVLDYAPASRASGKLRSGSDTIDIKLTPQHKIIERIKLPGKPKIGFKLEPSIDPESARKIATDYGKKYDLSLLIANGVETMASHKHGGFAVDIRHGQAESPVALQSRNEIATRIAAHIATWKEANDQTPTTH